MCTTSAQHLRGWFNIVQMLYNFFCVCWVVLLTSTAMFCQFCLLVIMERVIQQNLVRSLGVGGVGVTSDASHNIYCYGYLTDRSVVTSRCHSDCLSTLSISLVNARHLYSLVSSIFLVVMVHKRHACCVNTCMNTRIKYLNMHFHVRICSYVIICINMICLAYLCHETQRSLYIRTQWNDILNRDRNKYHQPLIATYRLIR